MAVDRNRYHLAESNNKKKQVAANSQALLDITMLILLTLEIAKKKSLHFFHVFSMRVALRSYVTMATDLRCMHSKLLYKLAMLPTPRW